MDKRRTGGAVLGVRAFEVGWSARMALVCAVVCVLGVVLGCVVLPASALGADGVYWANFGANKLSFVALDATGGGDLGTIGATVNAPDGVTIDAAAGRIYWANYAASKISFVNFDGSGGGDLNTTGATVDRPEGVAVDPGAPGGGRIYWANNFKVVSFANLDGSGGGDLNTTGATPGQPAGVAVDPDTPGGRIYWANPNGDKISFANLNGSGGGDLPTTGATVDGPWGVAVDPGAPGGGRIYWANENAGKLSYARLDGSGGGDLATLATTVNFPMYPALLQAPRPAAAPVVGGGATVGSTLSCSTGTWAADLTPAFLYRAPQSFAYQWSLDGTDTTGANASTTVANAPGAYRCRVTATNHAGSATQTSDPYTISPSAATAGATSPTAAPGGGATPTPAAGPTGANTASGPSNHFSIGRLRGTTLTVTLASLGTLQVLDASSSAAAKAAKKRHSTPFLRHTRVTGGPGDIALKLRLTAAATTTLKHHHQLTAKARLIFTPNAGTTATTTTKLTIKAPTKRKRRP